MGSMVRSSRAREQQRRQHLQARSSVNERLLTASIPFRRLWEKHHHQRPSPPLPSAARQRLPHQADRAPQWMLDIRGTGTALLFPRPPAPTLAAVCEAAEWLLVSRCLRTLPLHEGGQVLRRATAIGTHLRRSLAHEHAHEAQPRATSQQVPLPLAHPWERNRSAVGPTAWPSQAGAMKRCRVTPAVFRTRLAPHPSLPLPMQELLARAPRANRSARYRGRPRRGRRQNSSSTG